MKIFIVFQALLPFYILTGEAQPSSLPILRIETGMHTEGPGKMALDEAGKYLLTANDDKTARLWNAADGQLLNTFRVPIGNGKEGQLKACALSPNGMIAALGGNTGFQWDTSFCVYILNTENGQIIHRLTGLPKRICDVQFSPDGIWLAVALASGAGVNIYETATWKLTKNLDGYTDDVTLLAFSKNGMLATGGRDGITRLYNKRLRYSNFTAERQLASYITLRSFAFNPSGNKLAVGYHNSYGNEVEIFDGKNLDYLNSTRTDPDALAFSRNGLELFSGGLTPAFDSNEETRSAIRILKGDALTNDSLLPVTKSEILGIKVLPNGNIAVLGSLPEIAVLSPQGKLLWSKSTRTNDFKDFFINADATAFGVITRLRPTDTLKFNIKQRSQVERIAYEYGEKWENTFNTNSDINASHLHDAITPFLEDHETPIWFVNTPSGETVYGTDRYLTMFKSYSYGKPKLSWKTALPSETIRIRVTVDGKTIVVLLTDGTLRWYRMADGKELLTFDIDNDMKRWVLYTPSGYYDASAGAEDMLGWHINSGSSEAASFFPVSRFKQQYYRPEVIDSLLQTSDEDKSVAMVNRGGRKTAATNIAIKEKLPPVVTIINPGNGDTVNDGIAKVTYAVKWGQDGKVKNIKAMVNGRPAATEKGVKPFQDGNYEIDIKVPKANSKVTLLAENENGFGPEANLFLKYRPPVNTPEVFIKRPRLYVLAIGISDYQNPDYKLNYAAIDANGFITEIVKQKGNLYEAVVVKKLTDKAATKESIEDGLQWIQDQTLQQDVAMIFYAGHGVNDNDGIFYMLPTGADVNRLRSTCVNFEELRQTVSNIAGKVVVFIDACHSGNVMGSSGRRGTTDINAVINELASTQNGAVTFTSSTGKEYSLEDPAWKHGAFTLALLEGLDGKAALPGKNKITVKSLDVYISERVKDLTNGKQHSTSVVPPNVPDFPIAAW